MPALRTTARRILLAGLATGSATQARAQAAAPAPSGCSSHVFLAPAEPYRLPVAAARRMICDQLAGMPGVQVAVAVRGRLVWSEGFGYANLETREPVTRNTMYRIGSISKPLTADALARLVQAGRLDLDAPVQRYVPTFPEKPWPVTVRQLAGHLAGVRGYLHDYEENHANRHYPSVTAGLAIFAGDSLLFAPGTRFSYSTYGYSLLSAALEGASGTDFPTLMKREVFRPLGLRHTALDRPDSVIPERAAVYEPDATGALRPAPPVDNSYKWAGGGMLSTAEDLVRFGSAHLHPGRLSPRSLDLLFTSMRTGAGQETGYGAGWYVARDGWGHRVVSHTGSAVGGSSILVVDRDLGVVFAMAVNVSGTDSIGGVLGPVWGEIPALFDLGPRARPLLEAFAAADAVRIRDAYWKMRDSTTALASLVENHLNTVGYQKLWAGDVDGAIETLTVAAHAFPHSFNTWDSLGEAYAARGDTATAIRYYRESLRLNPNNDNGRRWLERLGVHPPAR